MDGKSGELNPTTINYLTPINKWNPRKNFSKSAIVRVSSNITIMLGEDKYNMFSKQKIITIQDHYLVRKYLYFYNFEVFERRTLVWQADNVMIILSLLFKQLILAIRKDSMWTSSKSKTWPIFG